MNRYLAQAAADMNLAAPCPSRVTLQVTVPLTHLCPFRDETDCGTVEIRWTTAGSTLELHALHAWLAGFRDDEVSHEDITETIRDHLADIPGIEDVYVTTRWPTAGMAVEVRGAVPGERVVAEGA